MLDRPNYAAVFGTRAHVMAALGRRYEALADFESAMKLADEKFVILYERALTKHGFYPHNVTGSYNAKLRWALAACLEAGCRVVK